MTSHRFGLVPLSLALTAGCVVGLQQLTSAAIAGYPSLPAALLAGCATLLWLLGHRVLGLFVFAALVPVFVCIPASALGATIVGAVVSCVVFGMASSPRGQRLRWLFWLQLGLVALLTQIAYLGAVRADWILGWPGADKLGHLLFFGLLALSLDRWLRCKDLHLGRLRLPLALLIVTTGAAIEELLQSLSPARTADPLDLVCDVVGMVLLIALGRCLLALPVQSAISCD